MKSDMATAKAVKVLIVSILSELDFASDEKIIKISEYVMSIDILKNFKIFCNLHELVNIGPESCATSFHANKFQENPYPGYECSDSS